MTSERTTRLTTSDVIALEARRIYGAEDVSAIAVIADRQGQRCEAVTHGTATRGRVAR